MERRLLALCLSCLLLLPATAAGLEIVAVSPSAAAPGSAVTVTGGPFSAEVTVIIGDTAVEPTALGSKQLIFTLPPLTEGEYALFLRDRQGTSPRPFSLTVIEPTPRIDSLAPSHIDACSSASDRRVTVTGRHIRPGATLLLGGNAVAHDRPAPDTVAFSTPTLAAGVYGVQVVNPGGKSSLPHSLYISDLPEILGVLQGEDFVNHYQLVIEGKNFAFGATLVVNEAPGGFFDIPPQQRIVGGPGRGSATDRLPRPSQSDRIDYIDCRTLVYNRYPYSSQPKEVTLQVVNPDGKSSAAYRLSTP